MKKEEYTKMNLLENKHFYFIGKQIFLQKILNSIFIHKKKRRILDVGCGTGAVTKLLERYGSVTAVEKNPLARTFARKKGIKVRTGEAERLPYARNSFDCVTIIDVLYHQNVVNIGKALKEVHRVLKKGGILVCVDSAMPYLKSAHDESVQGKRRFYLSEIRNVIKDVGFNPIYGTYLFFLLFPLVFFRRVVWSRLLKQKQSDVFPVHPLMNALLILILQFEFSFLPHITFPWGSSLIVIARKSI